MDSIQENIVNDVLAKLATKKTDFLDSIKRDIDGYISNLSIRDCLTIVMRNSSGVAVSTWYPKEALDGYLPRFIAFIRKKKYDGYVVDSYLTDKVVAIVTKHFQRFYTDNTDLLSKTVYENLLKDAVFVNTLCQHIIDASNSTLPAAIRSKLVSVLIHKLEEGLSTDIVSSTAHSIATMTTQVVGVATAIPITKTIAMVLMKNCAVAMKGIVAKILASSAFKTMLAATVKKMVAVKVLGALITFVGAKIGLGGGGFALGWVIWPLLVGFIAYEVHTLPGKLGKKISVEVCNELNGQYQYVNRQVVSQIVIGIVKSGASVFAQDIAQDEDMKAVLSKLAVNLT